MNMMVIVIVMPVVMIVKGLPVRLLIRVYNVVLFSVSSYFLLKHNLVVFSLG